MELRAPLSLIPFLPKKIEEGRIEDIRECIGCNICVSGDNHFVPIRCTQNPTMGEEWRRGWHPERIATRTNDNSVLIVGAGPAGLEAARALGQRGYRVTLADKANEAGGRLVTRTALAWPCRMGSRGGPPHISDQPDGQCQFLSGKSDDS